MSPPSMSSPAAGRLRITEIAIRPLTEADAGIYRAFRLLMLEESPTAFGSDLAEAAARPPSYFRKRASNQPDDFIMAAFNGNELVGSAGAFREQEKKRRHLATVVGMYVHPDHRGRGLGARLLDAVLQRLRALPDLEFVQLSVTAGNEPALKLYQRAGFTVYGLEPAALKVAGANHDELLMSLELG